MTMYRVTYIIQHPIDINECDTHDCEGLCLNHVMGSTCLPGLDTRICVFIILQSTYYTHITDCVAHSAKASDT